MKKALFLFILSVLIVLLVASPAIVHAGELPDYAREYIAEKLFGGIDPQDGSIDTAVEILTIPEAMHEYISTNDWERGQLAIFSADKLHILVNCPDGSVHNLVFRDGRKRKDQTIDEKQVRIMKRLYSAELFNMPPDHLIQNWMDKEEVDAALQFDNALALAGEEPGLELDDETVTRANTNYLAEDTKTQELARALGALAETEYPGECGWAAIWLISRMDNMAFRREIRENSVGDLSAVDARLFFENVYYAVKARNELASGRETSDEDFLNQVLSPRLTGEPLQRWRRHFFYALEPEVKDLTADEVPEAIRLARGAYNGVFQYEGATTWEDFGMLTALAVLEGRCEDCSNVDNAMLRTIGVPGCQAFTPWWGHQDGNHAWTWMRGVGEIPRDGRNGVKVYIKTWDGNEDVTSEYTPVTVIELKTESATDQKAELTVWNHDEWRVIARTEIEGGQAVFGDVGCRLNQALLIRIDGDPDRVADLRKDGTYRWLNLSPEAGSASDTVTVDYDKTTPFGEMSPAEDYSLVYYTVDGWKDAPSSRLSTGGFTFEAQTDRLYRITGPGIASRPFTVEVDPDTEEVITLRR